MPPNIEFDIRLRERCQYTDLKALIHIAGTFHNTKIDDIYYILQLFTTYQIIDKIYTMDDIKDEILLSRHLNYDVDSGIVINTLINDPTILYSVDVYIQKLIST